MKILKKIMVGLFLFIALLGFAVFLFLQQASFGESPTGERLERIKSSPNYKDGSFKNISETPTMSADASYLKILKAFIWKENLTEPETLLPTVKTDLTSTPPDRPAITWFGHSTYLIQAGGKNILVDPVFSERASPVQYAGSKNYATTKNYSTDDLPNIDYVIISHDHYDHLDYGTIVKLKSKVGKFYTPLGAGAHLEAWGIPANNIVEFDWWEGAAISSDLQLIATPARHFSGRSLTNRNSTLWASFVLIMPGYKIYIGGDSGYDSHFKEIGKKYGPFDLAILESGQYHPYWHNIHMMPEETVQASIDLQSKVLLPVHWAKFTLALHTWSDPIKRVKKKAEELNVKITTPMIGETIIIDSLYPDKDWWSGL